MFSLLVLIGRGLDLLVLLFTSFLFLLYSVFRGLALKYIVGVNCYEVPPVPIPNTEVKLIYVEDTWLVTARENRSMPTLRKHSSQVRSWLLYVSITCMLYWAISSVG